MTKPMSITDLSSIRMILCEHCGNKRCLISRRCYATHERLTIPANLQHNLYRLRLSVP